jgi:hypothetical protein
MVWQSREREEWTTVLDEVFGDEHVAAIADPFSLADQESTGAMLAGAGLTDVDFTCVDEPAWYGPDANSAVEAMLALQGTQARLAPLDERGREEALDRLHTALDGRCTRGGVFLEAHAWLITARRA